jgi:glutathionyl-hydroquinone reductase
VANGIIFSKFHAQPRYRLGLHGQAIQDTEYEKQITVYLLPATMSIKINNNENAYILMVERNFESLLKSKTYYDFHSFGKKGNKKKIYFP